MEKILLKGVMNEKNYSERVSRTEVFLGKNESEWKEAQKIL